jgi:antitoxin FitA
VAVTGLVGGDDGEVRSGLGVLAGRQRQLVGIERALLHEHAVLAARMLAACYRHAMPNLQIKNVPEELHEELRRRAEAEGVTLRDYVLRLLVRDQLVPTTEEWLAEVDALEPMPVQRPLHEQLAGDRTDREQEVERRTTPGAA